MQLFYSHVLLEDKICALIHMGFIELIIRVKDQSNISIFGQYVSLLAATHLMKCIHQSKYVHVWLVPGGYII